VCLPDSSWGGMLQSVQSSPVLIYLPRMCLSPGLFIAATTLSVNLLGDGVRDFFDEGSASWLAYSMRVYGRLWNRFGADWC